MTRLTKKYEDSSGYEPIETHNVCNVNLYDFNYADYECCVDKLGKIEDIMEKFNINSVEELIVILNLHKKQQEKIIDLSADLGLYQNENTNLTKDIEKYWGIKEQLGCPLEVVFKALKQGYIYVYDNHYNFDNYTKTKSKITFNNNTFYIGFARLTRRLEDYQKTWWLKGEKTNE